MQKRAFLAATIAAGLFLATNAVAQAPAAPKLDPNNTVYLDLPYGRVVIELRPDLAPKHVARVKLLCHEHFYDGTPFHRVIEGFMAQGGDPTGTGEGGSKYPNVPAEFSNVAKFVRGTVGAARASDPDSANSQFFIMFADGSQLNGQYTVFGKVVSGMKFVDNVKKGDEASDGMVTDPDKIISAKIDYK